MKESARIEDSLTFSQALKNIKSPSSTTLQSSRSYKQENFNQMSKSRSIGTFFSPGTKLTQRTNMTMKSLLKQFEINCHNQYILRLHHPLYSYATSKTFDQWICEINSLQNKIYPLRSKQNRTINFNNHFKTRSKASIESQIAKNIEKFQSKFNHKEQNNADKRQKCQLAISKIQNINKCSFAQYFQSFQAKKSMLLVEKQQNKQCKSISDTFREDQVIQESYLQKKGKMKTKIPLTEDMMQKGQKQNIDPNEQNQYIFVKGLEFSKNKRFKSTKKKRKMKI